ncbi:hypothetical protein P8452_74219 [Trifolium repens]|jgi:hypothetical protein|nr:hypothetical protein P8452_74219 [Trifolium repens]
MFKKALLVSLEYLSDPNFFQDPDSVNDILEFNRCLTKQLSFLQSNIEIIVDTSKTDRGNKQFDPTNVPYKLVKLIARPKKETPYFLYFMSLDLYDLDDNQTSTLVWP